MYLRRGRTDKSLGVFQDKSGAIEGIDAASIGTAGCISCCQSLTVHLVVTAFASFGNHRAAWSDSTTVLRWIEGDSLRWKAWVRNRASAIQETTEKLGIRWCHCPSIANPADLASRGGPVSAVASNLWQHGPEWLSDPEQWPATASGFIDTENERDAAEEAERGGTPASKGPSTVGSGETELSTSLHDQLASLNRSDLPPPHGQIPSKFPVMDSEQPLCKISERLD